MRYSKWIVGRWMAHEIVTVRPGDALVDAFERMQEKCIRHIPVINEMDKLVGIITDRDIRGYLPTRKEVSAGALAYSKMLMKTTIRSVMIPNPITVTERTTLQEAANLIFRNKFSALPVIDGDRRLVGIITTEDLLWALEHNLEELWNVAEVSPVK